MIHRQRPEHGAGHRLAQAHQEDLRRGNGQKAPAERATFLDSVCDGEPEVRARVERLLSMIDDDPGFLEEPPPTTGIEDRKSVV